jgi:molybdopterin converting factor small subunit
MSIKLYVLGGLSVITEGKHLFEVNGKTVGECLNYLVTLLPKMKEALFYRTGDTLALYSNIEVLINEKSTGAEGLAKEIKDGDEIHIKKNIQ